MHAANEGALRAFKEWKLMVLEFGMLKCCQAMRSSGFCRVRNEVSLMS